MFVHDVIHGLTQDEELFSLGRRNGTLEQLLIVLLPAHFIRADATHQPVTYLLGLV
ncbi:hypothetical protein D3C84_1073260 [compost metagenome]